MPMGSSSPAVGTDRPRACRLPITKSRYLNAKIEPRLTRIPATIGPRRRPPSDSAARTQVATIWPSSSGRKRTSHHA